MPQLKFNELEDVDTEASGFEVYDGPMPRPGVYSGKIKVMRVKIGNNSGNPYFSILIELNDTSSPEKAETKGCPIWTNIVPGDAEIQQIRTAQLFMAICGKKGPAVVHDEIDDGGDVKKVGGKNPIGTEVRVNIKKGSYQGEARAEISSIIPGKAKEEVDDIDEVDDEEEVEEAPAKKAPAKKAPAKRPAKKAEPEPEEEEEEEEESAEDEVITYSEAAQKTLIALKKLAKEAGYDPADLKEYKKKEELLELLVEDGVVAEEVDEDEAPF